MNMPEGQTQEFDTLWDQVLSKLEKNNFILIEEEKTPQDIKRFLEEVVLLNCPAFSRSTNQNDEYVFVIGSVENKIIYYLSYDLSGDIAVDTHSGVGFDINSNACWLYDEFHKTDSGYEHHVIFSDGKSYVIPFESFYLRTTAWFD